MERLKKLHPLPRNGGVKEKLVSVSSVESLYSEEQEMKDQHKKVMTR